MTPSGKLGLLMSDPTHGYAHAPREHASELELSVVMPCLNEADTLATCIEKAQRAIASAGIAAEIIVADNGSSDGSAEIAARCGARVVHVEAPGYGSSLMGGISAARGRFVIMGDSDDSYDFLELPRFVEELRKGSDLVQGCRLPSGGGRILPGAMPFLHRLGNPVLSALVRGMFGVSIHDIYCGMRGFTKQLFVDLDLRCTGMEFATEMIIKATLSRASIAEVPIVLHPDGRKAHAPHLKTFRDGWRTIRFFLMCSPRWMFLIPGAALLLLGFVGYGLVLSGSRIGSVAVDAHTLLVASLAILIGYQSILFAVFSKTFSIIAGLLPPDPRMDRLFEVFNLEKGILVGFGGFALGLFLVGLAANQWRLSGWGPLEYSETMRLVVPGVTLAALGFQTLLSSFFISIMGIGGR